MQSSAAYSSAIRMGGEVDEMVAPELHKRNLIESLIACHLRQDSAEKVRVAHEPIWVLVVLVGTNAIEAELGRQHQLVQRPVVIVGDLVGVPILPPRRINPRRCKTLWRKIRGEVAIRHEMEHRNFHGRISLWSLFRRRRGFTVARPPEAHSLPLILRKVGTSARWLATKATRIETAA